MNKSDAADKELLDNSPDGAVSSKAVAGYHGNQILSGSAATNTNGASITFPSGSLAIDAVVAMAAGNNLATQPVANNLTPGNSFLNAGGAVSVSSNPAQNATSGNAFILSIPMPGQTSLSDSSDRLVVLYEYYNAQSKSYTYGVMPSGTFEISGAVIKVHITFFGTYQAAYTATKIAAPVSKVGTVKDIPQQSSTNDVATITGVKALSVDGLYSAGQSVNIQVQFSKAVVVSGTPKLTLKFTSGNRDASYVSGSNSDKLQFSYVVQASDVSSKLDYASATPFTLSGASIVDSAGQSANLTAVPPGATGSLGASSSIQVYGTAIVVSNVTSTLSAGQVFKAGDTVMVSLQFSGNVVVTGTPQLTMETGTTDAVASYTGGTGSNSLVFSFTVVAGYTSSLLNYTLTSALALDSGTIQGTSGEPVSIVLPAAASNGLIAKAFVIDTTAPSITGVGLVGGGTATNSTTPTIQYTSDEPAQVKLYMDSSCLTTMADTNTVVAAGARTLAFTSSAGADGAKSLYLRAIDTIGNSTSCQSVGSFTVDTAAPTVLNVTSSKANGSYSVPTVIDINVNFSESVVVAGGTPTIALNTGGGGSASYLSGSGSSILVFRYTVAVAQNAANLDYLATTSLALAGATIKDPAGNSANTLFAAPGATNSLSNAATRKIDTTAPTVAIAVSGNAISTSTTMAWNVTFSEAVTGFTSSSVTLVGNGSITISGTGSAYILTVNATATDGNAVTPTINSGAAIDAAGNGSVANTGNSITYYIPASISAVTMTPTAPGLTLTPNFSYTLDRAADSIGYYSDASCSSAIGSSILNPTLGANSNTLPASLPTTGTTSVYAQTARYTTIKSNCTSMGTYTTGVNKVVVASATASPYINWACAITNGGLKCWGDNVFNQLTGASSFTASATPITVYAVNSGVTEVAQSFDWTTNVNYATTCAIKSGAVYCWGDNHYGQIGNNASGSTPVSTPSQVLDSSLTALTDIGALSAATGTFCALKSNGDLYCWGRNNAGQVGNGSTTDQQTAVKMNGSDSYAQVAVGDHYACGVTTLGAAKCWGLNSYGVIGNGTFSNYLSSPTQVTGLTSGVAKISVNDNESCAVMTSGALKCWGKNDYGQVGDNSSTMRKSPVAVTGLASGVADVVAAQSTYVSMSDASLKSWGNNSNYELFTGDTSPYWIPTLPAVPSVLPTGYSVASFGYSMAGGSKDVVCAVISGGVFCRAHSSPSYGAGQSSYPIATNSGVNSVSASSDLSCAVMTNNSTVKCWGNQRNGQMPSGSSYTPVVMSSLP